MKKIYTPSYKYVTKWAMSKNNHKSVHFSTLSKVIGKNNGNKPEHQWKNFMFKKEKRSKRESEIKWEIRLNLCIKRNEI